MVKAMAKRKALKLYSEYGKHDIVLLSFTYNNEEYIIMTNNIPARWTYWTYHRKAYHLRMHLKRKDKRKLIKRAGCMKIGKTTEVFSKADEYNKGDQLERYIMHLVTDQEWSKNYTPWYEDADITLNGVKIQVKRENATICSLSSLYRVTAE